MARNGSVTAAVAMARELRLDPGDEDELDVELDESWSGSSPERVRLRSLYERGSVAATPRWGRGRNRPLPTHRAMPSLLSGDGGGVAIVRWVWVTSRVHAYGEPDGGARCERARGVVPVGLQPLGGTRVERHGQAGNVNRAGSRPVDSHARGDVGCGDRDRCSALVADLEDERLARLLRRRPDRAADDHFGCSIDDPHWGHIDHHRVGVAERLRVADLQRERQARRSSRRRERRRRAGRIAQRDARWGGPVEGERPALRIGRSRSVERHQITLVDRLVGSGVRLRRRRRRRHDIDHHGVRVAE